MSDSELTSLCELSADELREWCAEHDQPAYRADQIRSWMFEKRAGSFEEMLNLPKTLRDQLTTSFTLFPSEVVSHQVATDRTEKLLLKLSDDHLVECVLMRETSRRTVCISTQVGCAMGCVFCASGLLGVKRDLTTGEILEQIFRMNRLLSETEQVNRLTNLVVMGIGEPLANLSQLLPALDLLHEPDTLNLGARRITISTVGLPEKIRELAAHGKPYNLAISLHAPNDELRTELVPVNRNIGIDAILQAADEYFNGTGRRVSYEYVLLGSVNDHPEHAKQLAKLLRNRNAHVNLIPMNDVTELPYHQPTEPRTDQFLAILEDGGINATVRKRKGADIDAACGQLRLKSELTQLSDGESGLS